MKHWATYSRHIVVFSSSSRHCPNLRKRRHRIHHTIRSNGYLTPIGAVNVPNTISWADEERDVSAWLGNKLQQSALKSLYEMGERVRLCTDRRLKQDWIYLQTSDHFHYMSTKHFGSGESQFSPYMSPYDAFNNYMNVLSDFISRVKAQYPDTVDNEELNALLTTIHNQEMEIKRLQSELKTVIGSNEELLVERSNKKKASTK